MNTYRVYWPIPPTGQGGTVIISSSEALADKHPDFLARDAVKRLVELAKQCPAGGVMPKPLEGERFALQSKAGKIDPSPLPDDLTLVLLDAYGTPYDHAEIARVA